MVSSYTRFRNISFEYTYLHLSTVVSPYPWGIYFVDSQGMPEILDSTETYINCFFLYIHSYDKVYKLDIVRLMMIIKQNNYNNL